MGAISKVPRSEALTSIDTMVHVAEKTLQQRVPNLIFEHDYFKGGDVSNYQDYVLRKHGPLADNLISVLNLKTNDVVIDYGAATGSLILELIKRGLPNVYGTDQSFWAVDFGLNNFNLEGHLFHYNRDLLTKPKDYVFCFDVLEHVPSIKELVYTLSLAREGMRKGMVVRIPVAEQEGDNFVLDVSRNDRTHIQCHSKRYWDTLFRSTGFIPDSRIDAEAIYDRPGVLCAVYRPDNAHPEAHINIAQLQKLFEWSTVRHLAKRKLPDEPTQ